MDANHVQALLQSPESEHLDFKLEYPRNKATLVHDILCLANSLNSQKRYLIFGIEDGTRSLVGIQSDPNRLTRAALLDILSNAKVNRLPALRIETIRQDSSEVDIVVIENCRTKPYRLLQDYTYEGTTVRAGVVYCRNGDRNTPVNGSASDAEIRLMYLEEMGLDLTPSERFDLYLADTEGWEYVEDRDPSYFFYRRHPEFQIMLT